MRLNLAIATVFLVVMVGGGCRKSKSNSGDDSKSGQLTMTLAIAQTSSNSLREISALTSPALALPQLSSVPASGTNLKSLKLHINDIQICKDITLNGTAMSRASGCITLYRAPENQRLSDTANIKEALRAAGEGDTGFIDLMNPASLQALNQSVAITQENIGAYNYGIMNVSGPVKVKAIMVDPNDGTTPVLYTKATAPGDCAVNNQQAYSCAVATSAMTNAPAEEAIFNGAGGGAMVTKFQQPFNITEEDINNRQNYSLTLAFNPDSLVQGVTSGGATNFPPMTDATVNNGYNLGNTMTLVGAQFAGIFYKTSAGSIVAATPTSTAGQDPNVVRESYLGTYTLPGGNGTASLRVEFYSLSSDPQKSIYGVSTATIPTANTKTYLIGWQRIYGVTTNSDGTINLLDYQGNNVLSNFKRVTTIGASTQGAIACDTVLFNCTSGTPFSQTFKLASLGAM